MKRTTTIAVGIFCVVCAATMMGGCLGVDDIGSVGQNVIGSNHLTIVDSHAEVGKTADMYVLGTIRNDGNDMFHAGDLKITIYDRNGNVIKETVSRVFQTYPGETSDFRALCSGNQYKQAGSYKIEIVHQNWGDIDAVNTMKMITTATGKITPVATSTPSSVSGKTTSDIVVKYPVTTEFDLHYVNTPDDRIHHLTMEMKADGTIDKHYTGPRPVGEEGTYMHRVGGHWTLLEHDSDSYKYTVPDESFGYPVPDDRQKYLTLHKDGTVTLEGECGQLAQGYWSRAVD